MGHGDLSWIVWTGSLGQEQPLYPTPRPMRAELARSGRAVSPQGTSATEGAPPYCLPPLAGERLLPPAAGQVGVGMLLPGTLASLNLAFHTPIP